MREHGAMDQSMNFSEQVETNNSIGEPQSLSYAEQVAPKMEPLLLYKFQRGKKTKTFIFSRETEGMLMKTRGGGVLQVKTTDEAHTGKEELELRDKTKILNCSVSFHAHAADYPK